jgi:hypothetical protein
VASLKALQSKKECCFGGIIRILVRTGEQVLVLDVLHWMAFANRDKHPHQGKACTVLGDNATAAQERLLLHYMMLDFCTVLILDQAITSMADSTTQELSSVVAFTGALPAGG